MGLTYWKVKLCNLLIGIICFGLTIYTYTHTSSEMLTEADMFGVVMTSLVIVESTLAALFCVKIGDCCCYLCYKCIWCFTLSITGATLLLEAFTFWEQKYPSCFTTTGAALMRRRGCQFMEIRIVLGVLFVINGILYLCTNPERSRVGVNAPLRPSAVIVTGGSGNQGLHASNHRGNRFVARPPGGRTTTVITTNTPGATAIVNIHNTSVTQPLISRGASPVPGLPARPVNASSTHAPRYENQGAILRPLPPLPNEMMTGNPTAPHFPPSAPPPSYFDAPPPYSTLPPNTRPPAGTERT